MSRKKIEDAPRMPRRPPQDERDADDDKLDEELEDTFPASDPPSHTPCRPVREEGGS